MWPSKTVKTALFAVTALLGFFPAVGAQPQILSNITDTTAANPAEIAIAINPANRNHLVAVALQFRHGDGSKGITNYSHTSLDGGKTWKSTPFQNQQRRTQGDDAIAALPNLFFRSYIAFDGIRTKSPKLSRNGIFVASSGDGLSWTEPVPVVDHINTVLPFEDKPWLLADDQQNSPFAGRLYVSWTRFDEYGSSWPSDSSSIYFSASADSGKTFSMPRRISDHAGNCLDDGNTVEGAVPSVDSEGNVYVAWSGPLGIMLDKSTDGGLTFGKDVKIADHVGGWDIPVADLKRHNGMPVLKTDLSSGSLKNSLYVVWIDRRNQNPDVWIAWSRDRGQTWSEPQMVNEEENQPVDQLFAWLAVDPADGSVNVAYLTRDTASGGWRVMLSRSRDGGFSFDHFPVYMEPFQIKENVFFGDYIGLDARDRAVAVAFPRFVENGKLILSSAVFDFGKVRNRSRPRKK